jgi:dTDP-4-dehydrorhamnose 3,5-epimerase-like enzyme
VKNPTLLDQVTLISRTLKEDERGWFLKVIDGHEENIPLRTGEVYLTMAVPGEVRGNHYHQRTAEWFTVVAGRALLRLHDLETLESRDVLLESSSPLTVYVPAGVAHAFKNPEDAEEQMLLVAYADNIYDPGDTIPLKLL